MHRAALKFSPMDIDHTTLAKNLGISNAVLGTAKKKLTPGLHFTTTKPHRFTPAGVMALESHFGIAKKTATPCCKSEDCKCLTVTGHRGRFVLATDSSGQTWQVEVRTPELFARSMIIPIARYTVSTARPLYARQKGRSPRTRGRW